VESWSGVTSRQVSYTLPNTDGANYYWQVEAEDSTGLTTEADGGTWHFFWADLAVPPTAFSKQAPANNDPVTSRNVTLSWGASTDPNGGNITYNVTLNTDDSILVESWSGVTSRQVSYTLPNTDGANYYWQVEAEDSTGLTTEADGGSWHFFWADLSADTTLSYMLIGRYAVLFWPTNRPGFTLQYTPTLAPSCTWRNVTETPTIEGGYYTVTDQVSAMRRFYRLSKPRP